MARYNSAVQMRIIISSPFQYFCMSSDVLIPITEDIQGKLDALKKGPQEGYNEVLVRLLTAYDLNTLSEEDQRDIEQSIREIHEGKYCIVEDLMKEEGLL
jgi:isocitrate dehydrogenase kinase/phosphatase